MAGDAIRCLRPAFVDTFRIGSSTSPSDDLMSASAPKPRSRRGRRSLFVRGLLLFAALAPVLAAVALWETRTSTLQARYFGRLVEDVAYEVRPGPSPRILFPEEGPWDERLGYVRLPAMLDSLERRGFRIVEQARVTGAFADLVDRGYYPLYEEKPAGGLTLLDRRGDVIHRSLHPARAYTSFDSIPEILWRSLLWIESRDFLDPGYPTRNPAVEWDRLARSVFEMGLRALGSDRNVPGGSTLATQLEKFRHSPEGRTPSPGDKLRQMKTASARAYLEGPETLEAQRRVVRSYLNTVPLAAQQGHGEVVGVADGLWAWYGTPFDEANRLLKGEDLAPEELDRRGEVYRQALSLMIAHRRPSWHLVRPEGREELRALTDQHVRLLRDAGIVPPDLAAAAARAEIEPLRRAPQRPPISFVERKAANQLRAHLLPLLGLPSVYDLDRIDATAHVTLDLGWQEEATGFFRSLADPAFLRSEGFGAARLLDRGDPAGVLYSFTLLETTPIGSVVRVQADNYEGPMSLTTGGRLELGSTAKLRTLVTYMDVVAELHARLAELPPDSLRRLPVTERDRLTRWAAEWLLRNPDGGLRAMLDAAMERSYSASPAERFATGGGVQTFSNFDAAFDSRVLSVAEAFRHSVNLPWIRAMRDVVHYYMFGTGTAGDVLADPELRQEYLARFADEEGSRFVARFHRKYATLAGPEILEALVRERSLGPQRLAWAIRAVDPAVSPERFATLLRDHALRSTLSDEAVRSLYGTSDPAGLSLNDLGFLSRIHPLELWVARHLLERPGASLDDALAANRDTRQEVYRWLFRTRHRNAQDQRIRTVLEIEAFERLLTQWRRLGYPFRNIVPSYGTAIGSSGDTPLALAELVGILLNDGVRYPVARIGRIAFAERTPFHSTVAREPAEGERVLPTEVAAVAREALRDVVENGTARRATGAFTDAGGAPLPLGGKTGTGDNRMRVYGQGGRLAESRVINRTATLVFFTGDRHFGVVTAYVPGSDAARYGFTSALPSQILRTLAPSMSPLAADGDGGAPRPGAGEDGGDEVADSTEGAGRPR